ncbi:phytanoyl-CoA dioxygenase family protein [Streptomyces sp. NPDC052396]|uniref:phytanoyl-CoA dioxygenase family protein n=1 Tax=Streptomyces sp. NPDC052396 TaxID=3365689 RepID=UPI0037CCCB6E
MLLSSNGLSLPFTEELFTPLRDSSALIGEPDALNERLWADGCLYLPQLLDRSDVLQLRAAYFGLFDASYFAPGTMVRDGIFSGRVPVDLPAYGVAGHPAHSFVRSEIFQRFLDNPVLTKLAEGLLGGSTEMLPRRILRHFHRGSRLASRAHVDYDYMDRGSHRVLTAWIPVGDCPPATGGLVYLEKSHTLPAEDYAPLRGITDRPQDRRPISHDLRETAHRLNRRWMWADYRAGDVMVHLPHIIHASLDTTTDAMRVSVDTRFVRGGDRPDPRWLRPWSADDGA